MLLRMQRRHSVRHLFWRSGIAAVSHAMMFTGAYPLVPHALRILGKADVGTHPVRAALGEWGMSVAVSVARPAGFLPLPGARTRGPRPVIVLHGYAMNRANFLPLAYRLSRAGIGPIMGFEYWTFGRTAAAARQLGWFVDRVRAELGVEHVDLIGHSMGGLVARYYVSLMGGDDHVKNLVTIGSPHGGTDIAGFGLGHSARELMLGSKLLTRLAAAQRPRHTRVTVVLSRGDALVPSVRHQAIPGADVILYEDLGHLALLGSRRVADELIARLQQR
jgi:triacylglycerol esterase/lipase EstA (alpha/beta hydrolase family)